MPKLIYRALEPVRKRTTVNMLDVHQQIADFLGKGGEITPIAKGVMKETVEVSKQLVLDEKDKFRLKKRLK